MEYAVQDIKVSENLVQAEVNARASKTGFYAVFLSRIRFLCMRDYQLILCMLEKHNYRAKFAG